MNEWCARLGWNDSGTDAHLWCPDRQRSAQGITVATVYFGKPDFLVAVGPCMASQRYGMLCSANGQGEPEPNIARCALHEGPFLWDKSWGYFRLTLISCAAPSFVLNQNVSGGVVPRSTIHSPGNTEHSKVPISWRLPVSVSRA